MVDIYVPFEEKKETLEELLKIREHREKIKEYPFVPVFKNEEELKWALEHRRIDFIADAEYWIYSIAKRWGIVRRIKAWGRSEIGYTVNALSIRKAIECVNAVILAKRDKYSFIYFRIFTPDTPLPRFCYVDEDLAFLEEQIREFSRPGEYVNEDYYER